MLLKIIIFAAIGVILSQKNIPDELLGKIPTERDNFKEPRRIIVGISKKKELWQIYAEN